MKTTAVPPQCRLQAQDCGSGKNQNVLDRLTAAAQTVFWLQRVLIMRTVESSKIVLRPISAAVRTELLQACTCYHKKMQDRSIFSYSKFQLKDQGTRAAVCLAHMNNTAVAMTTTLRPTDLIEKGVALILPSGAVLITSCMREVPTWKVAVANIRHSDVARITPQLLEATTTKAAAASIQNTVAVPITTPLQPDRTTKAVLATRSSSDVVLTESQQQKDHNDWVTSLSKVFQTF